MDPARQLRIMANPRCFDIELALAGILAFSSSTSQVTVESAAPSISPLVQALPGVLAASSERQSSSCILTTHILIRPSIRRFPNNSKTSCLFNQFPAIKHLAVQYLLCRVS